MTTIAVRHSEPAFTGSRSDGPWPDVPPSTAERPARLAEPVRIPSYPVAAIDNTLRTLQLLNSVGEVRVVDVANHLDVARSTAHRILTMLTYHGFAEQDQAKHYRLCRQLDVPGGDDMRALVTVAHPALMRVATATGHTAHLVVLEGNGARFLHGVAPRGGAQLTIRDGLLYPAHLTAGGRCLLAELPPRELRALFPARIGRHGVPAVDHRGIDRMLAHVRHRGYAVNEGENETGVNAVGIAVRLRSGTVAALTVADRADRLPRSRFAALASVLFETAKPVIAAGNKSRSN